MSPNLFSSALASANSFLIFSSDSPTNLLKISGPFTIFRSLTLRAFANCLAIRVFPVPGGPKRRIPLTCLIPNLLIVSFEYLLDAKVLLKILKSYSSRPPIPISSIEKSGLNILFSFP